MVIIKISPVNSIHFNLIVLQRKILTFQNERSKLILNHPESSSNDQDRSGSLKIVHFGESKPSIVVIIILKFLCFSLVGQTKPQANYSGLILIIIFMVHYLLKKLIMK